MSKEQTPITAEEFLKDDEFVNVKGFIKESGTLKTTTSLMEQYAKAKVLEALEREVTKTHLEQNIITQKYIVQDMQHEPSDLVIEILKKQAKEYYETEVKPKYER